MAVLVGSHAIALAGGGSGGTATAWLVVFSAALPPMIVDSNLYYLALSL